MRTDQLGVQLHCLRHAVREGLADTLGKIRGLGFEVVELVSFPGCRGNPWGDFGAASDLAPGSIRAALDDAGLRCPSVMVYEKELSADGLDGVLEWARGVGADTVVLTALAAPSLPTLAQWQVTVERANQHAERCRGRGMTFVLHTQPELWASVERHRPIDCIGSWLDRELVSLEYDPSGALVHRADPLELLSRWPGRFHAVHLRDGQVPTEPVPYLPALPLGQGCVDWGAFLRACRSVDVSWYFLEMEVADPGDTLGAFSSSLAHLAGLGIPGRHPPGVARE